MYPTMREATKRFKCSMDDIENVISDDLGNDNRYLGLVVAWGINGGCANIEHRGDYGIEAY